MNYFIDFELSKTKANNTDFRTGKPVDTPPRDEFCQSLYENPGPKPVLFVSKTIIPCTNWVIQLVDSNYKLICVALAVSEDST